MILQELYKGFTDICFIKSADADIIKAFSDIINLI